MSKRKGLILPIPKGVDLFEEHEIRKLNRRRIATPEQSALLKNIEGFVGKIPVVDSMVSAKYVAMTDSFFLLDAGFKDYVKVPRRTFENSYFNNFNLGENVDVNIDSATETPFYVEGSILSLYERKAKKMLLALQEKGEHLTATAVSYQGGGYNVEMNVNGVTFNAFMPTILADVNKMVNPETLIGQSFNVFIDTDTNDDNQTLIVSRRAYLETLIPQKVETLEQDKVYTGTVTGTTNFGVFIQFEEYLTGMIHVSNIDPKYRENLHDIPAGTSIDFYIKAIIKQRDGSFKIMLSQYNTKSLIDELKVGEVLSGQVIQVQHYGALVAFDEDTKGLIPTFELENKKVSLSEKQTVKVKVQEIDKDQRKMTLSIVK